MLACLLLMPSLLGSHPQGGHDTTMTATVKIKHHSQARVFLGRQLSGAWGREQYDAGSSRWGDYEIFWGYPLYRSGNTGEHSVEGRIYSGLRPGKFALWVLDTTFRLKHETFTLEKGETRVFEAVTGTMSIGKKAIGS